MDIQFTNKEIDFLNARFETDDATPFVQKMCQDWINHLIEVAYAQAPKEISKIDIATQDILDKRAEKEAKNADIIKK